MKVFVVGLRGIPDVPGGVERHCEHLYPGIVTNGCNVLLSRRRQYVSQSLFEWEGISLIDLYAPSDLRLEAIVHTFISVLKAWRWKADIVHIHAIGPALVVPLARILGLRVVVTNHGPDYDRHKWGRFARLVLRLGEYLGCKYAHEVIVISEPIREIVRLRCARDSHLIYNGVPAPYIDLTTTYIESLCLQPQGYFLAVARLVPEKGLHDLIDAYAQLNTGYKLVIAGDSDYKDEYSDMLKARRSHNVIMPGYVTGRDLAQLYTHARMFVMPSYHEGLPIALLEALSYGLPVLVSDIAANREIKLAAENYFPVGDIDKMRIKLDAAQDQPIDTDYVEKMRASIKSTYNWDSIVEQTLGVYKTVLS